MTQTISRPPPPPPFRHVRAAPLIPPSGNQDWRAVLRDCGMPGDIVVIDFETYFDSTYHMGRSKDSLSTIEYITDKRFEVLGCSFLRVPKEVNHPNYEGDTVFRAGEKDVVEWLGYLINEYGKNLEGCTVVAQNAVFDCTILSKHYNISPPHIIDVLGLARHWHSRSNNDLGSLAKRHKLPEKGETEEFKGLTLRKRFIRPRKSKRPSAQMPVQAPIATDAQIAKLAEYARNDVMREWELFTILLPKLSNPKIELRLIQHTLDLYLKPRLTVDREHGTKLIADMTAEIDKAMVKVGTTREQISGDKSFESLIIAALIKDGYEYEQYFKPMKRGPMLAIAKDDIERKQLENHTSENVRNLMAARIALDSWPIHITRVENIMKQAAANGGLLPVPLAYCGAHTRRWSGKEKINLQNLGTRGHPLVNAVRQMLVAIEGQILAIVDAAQIEARVLAWIAGQADLCDAFANNRDVYCEFGTKFFGVKQRKAAKTDPPPVADLYTKRRQFSKICVLGMGYGMGKDRFSEYATCDLETAERAVKVYREAYTAIPQFWRDIEKAFIYTAKYKKPCEMPRGLRFHSTDDCDVVLTLPNGGELKYHQVKVVTDSRYEKVEVYNSQTHSWDYLWGGVLTENVVQAISRDILAEAMLRLEDLGYPTAHHCHDEWIGCVAIDQGEKALRDGIVEMSRRPAWALDCPLGAEGVLSKAYGKH